VSFVKKVGEGYVIMLGTLPEEKELLNIIGKAAALSGAHVYDTDDGIMVTKRVADGDTLYIVAAVGGKAGQYRFDGEYTDLLSGEGYKDVLNLKPYELRILKKV